MKSYYFSFVLLHFVIVQCIVPNLIVNKIDRTLIARKRQDTMDMCKIFIEENEMMQHKYTPNTVRSYRPVEKYEVDAAMSGAAKFEFNNNELNRRYKRNVVHEDNEKLGKDNQRFTTDETLKHEVNPALNSEDKKRIETIVDKLYDDMQDKEHGVPYRHNYQTLTITTKARVNETQKSRRFNFAPADLKGPDATPSDKSTEDNNSDFKSKARWKHGIVPYFIDSKTYDTQLTETITKAFDYFEKATCIRLQKLREKPTDIKSMKEVSWLYISNPTGIRQCVHSNERRIVNGVQMTVFGYDCLTLGDIVHEVMHILGFSHEHLRSNRDQYISILWDNIKPGYKKYFVMNEAGTGYDLESFSYDYTSIMHYPPKAFSRNGKTTILTEPGVKIGQREGLSEIDVEKVALIYSNECVSRNKEYLFQTCPSVVRSVTKPVNVTRSEIKAYFENRLWPYGIITYKLSDKVEFSTEERENLKAVFRHIEKETCVQFKDTEAFEENDSEGDENGSSVHVEDQKETTKNDNEIPMTTDQPEINSTTIDYNEPKPDTNTDGHDKKVPEQGDKGENEQVEKYLAADSSSFEKNTNNNARKKVAEIVISNPTDDGKVKFDENEIEKDDEKVKINLITEPKLNNYIIKNMNFTMKKALLRKAKAKQLKQKSKRFRRDANSQTRRHSVSVLTLKRSPAPDCPCPEPGTPTGNQVLEIGAGCFNSVNDLLHFFVHVLGLNHQHNMHDRDNYLHILWDNLSPDVRKEMAQKLPPAASVGFSYDYQSVMHYPWLQIKNGRTNIMYPVWNDGWSMGHWQGLSSIDVQKINLLYFDQCTERQKQEKQ